MGKSLFEQMGGTYTQVGDYILLPSVNGLRRNLLYTLMTATLQSLMVTNLRLSDSSETDLKVLLPKQFM